MAFERRKIQLDPEMKQRMESSSRNIFEVFYSTTTTPPTGAFPLWTGEWIVDCASVYPTFYQKALEYQSNGSIRTLNNTQYESEVSTYKQCGAFVIQGNDIRLPMITRFVRSFENAQKQNLNGTSHLSGVPGIKGGNNGRVCRVESIQEGGPFYNAGYTGGSYRGGDAIYWLGFDFGRVSPVYGRYDNDGYGFAGEVTPACVNLPLYIQVYHGVSDQSLVNIGAITNQISQLSAKVTELTRQLETYKTNNFGAPDHTRRVVLTPEASSTEVSYTPSVNGYISGFFMRSNDGATEIDLIIGDVTYTNWSRPGSYYVNGHMSVLMPVKAGQTVIVKRTSGNWTSSKNWLYFIPCA